MGKRWGNWKQIDGRKKVFRKEKDGDETI